MVGERLAKECDRLVVEDGWQWAAIESDLPKSWRSWATTRVDISKVFTPEEEAKAKALAKREEDIESSNDWNYEDEEAVRAEIEALEAAVMPRAFTEKQKAKLGCMVAVDETGKLEIVYGISLPPAATASEAAARAPIAGEAPEIKAPAKGKAAEPDLRQLTVAAQTALIQEHDLAISVLLANFASSGHCDGIRASVSGLGYAKLDLLGGKKFADNLELALALKPADRVALLVLVAGGALDFQRFSSNDDILLKGNPGLICNTIAPATMNAALRGAFEAKDYFSSVPKALCLAAIKEAIGADAARQQEKKKTPEIAAFALANVPPTGWLPPQLRAKGYDGPPVAKGKLPAPKPAARAKPVAKAAAPLKRAASAKKAAKKTSAKKRPAKKGKR
jgi:ParB family chromosome partitioning protein